MILLNGPSLVPKSAGNIFSTYARTAGSLSFAAIGTYSIQIDSDVSVVQAGENLLNISQGSFSLEQSTNESVTTAGLLQTSVGNTVAGLITEVPVTGNSASLTLGTPSLDQSTNESATGQALTLSLGTQGSIPQNVVGLTGLPLTMAMGEEGTVGNALVEPTGIVLTSSTGSPNITAWSEVNLGVNNVWTEVDLAA